MNYEELWQAYQALQKRSFALERQLVEAQAENEKLWEGLMKIAKVVKIKTKEACGL